MLKMNMQFETQYALRQYGSCAMDARSIGFADGALVSSRVFPGAAAPAVITPVFAGGAVDGLPMSSAGLLTGLMPSISSGGSQGVVSCVSTVSGTATGVNHLATPTGVAAADTGLGMGGSTYSLTITWTNGASYNSSDIMVAYNNAGGAVLGMSAATSGTMTITGLTNTAYTINVKNTWDFIHFSSSVQVVQTPTGANVNLPLASNVLTGVAYGPGPTTGTLNLLSPVVEASTGLTVRQTLQLMSAVLFGVDTVTGTSVVFKDATGANTHVTATMSGNQRTAITTSTSA